MCSVSVFFFLLFYYLLELTPKALRLSLTGEQSYVSIEYCTFLIMESLIIRTKGEDSGWQLEDFPAFSIVSVRWNFTLLLSYLAILSPSISANIIYCLNKHLMVRSFKYSLQIWHCSLQSSFLMHHLVLPKEIKITLYAFYLKSKCDRVFLSNRV